MVVLGVLAAAAIVMAAVVLLGGSEDYPAAAPLPLHPVAGGFVPDQTRLEDCSEQRCLEQAFGNIAYRQGPKAALRALDIRYVDGSDPACHRIAHSIGSASLSRFHGDVSRTFAQGSASCWSGYYHGVLERSLIDVKSYSPVALGNIARRLCDGARVRAVAWLAYQCLHGLGHGLMITTGYDLPRSLATCRRLATDWDRTSCKGGVFMENLSSSYGFTSPWLRDDDPVYPCDAVPAGDKRTCYELVTSRILRVLDGDWEKTAETCATVEREWVTTCFRSFGRDVSGRTMRDPTEIVRLCAIAHPFGGDRPCIVAAAMDMTANFTSGLEASVLCRSVGRGLRGDCFAAIGTIMGRFRTTNAERAADCRGIATAEGDLSRCVAAARRNATLMVAQ